MDRRGEGVPVILSASGKLSGKRPKYELIDDSELKLTIFAAPADDKAALKKIAAGLSTGTLQTVQTFTDMETLDKIKELIRANPRITQNEMSKACGISRTSIANWIKKSKGTIRRVGFDNGGFWQVVEH
jgi:predicted HTH transcriptional regulator